MKRNDDEVAAIQREKRQYYANIVKNAAIYGKQYALYHYAYWEDRILYRIYKQFNKTVAQNILKK